MRTTVNLDEDVAAAVERLRREKGLGLSEAVNQLTRSGLAAVPQEYHYVHRIYPMGLRIDVSHTGEVLDLLDRWESEEG
jgi:hypothetical protein